MLCILPLALLASSRLARSCVPAAGVNMASAAAEEVSLLQQQDLQLLKALYKTSSDLSKLGLGVIDGKVYDVHSGEGFRFSGDSHYDKVADAVTQIVQHAMMRQGVRPELLQPEPDQAGCDIFVSDNISASDVVCVLVQGLGAVRYVCQITLACAKKSLPRKFCLQARPLGAKCGNQ